MIKEIKYNGYSANPSDYECADGDLATSIGVIPENGALKPILPPSEVLQLESGASVMYIHETANIKHYIIFKNNAISWWDGIDGHEQVSLRTFKEIYQINAIGNTLLVLSEDGMHYFLWKGYDDGYLYLGTKIPECPLSFGLQGEMTVTDEFELAFDDIAYETDKNIWNGMTTATDPFCKEFTDNNKRQITDQVLGKVNKFIAENSTGKGKFLFPFFVRYAYRLYDGTLTMHSAPILMIASSDCAPNVGIFRVFSTHAEHSANRCKAKVIGVTHGIDYAVIHNSRLEMIKNWRDIVRSVDVFVSKPIYTYNQNGQCTQFVRTVENDCYSVCKFVSQNAPTSTYPMRYQRHDVNYMYQLYTNNFQTIYGYRLMIPRRSIDDVKEDIRSTSQFYLLESIPVEQLTTTRTKLVVEEDYLQSLVTREVMTDDYDSHDKLLPNYSFVYNSRLNLANIRKELYYLYNIGAMIPYTNGYVANWNGMPPTQMDGTMGASVYFYIKQDGRDIVVSGESYSVSFYSPPFLFLFYPNINAYKAVIVTHYGFPQYYEVMLEQHKFLNGAFYFAGWENPPTGLSDYPTASPREQRIIDLPNKIYTSEINNPFHFPVLGINTIGTGTILGISSAVKALSEGQFGQFPLYAFTTEGVWALEVSATGTYSAKQPITRDVVINPDSITQIDSSVLFATDRGIMHISGSATQCLSDSLNAEDLFSIADLPKANALIDIFNGKAGENEKATLSDITLLPFNDFLRECRMVYDYTNQHIIVYNPTVRYAYVFSLKSKLWGMMLSDIVNNVNSYPEALAMADGNRLVDFSTSSAETITALVVTRPFKMEEPDVFKTIDTIIQRGYFKPGHVAQVLYGSNDLFNWHTVWSSTDKYMRGFRGTPYKAFRIALICTLDRFESLLGFSAQFNPRMLNRLR
jgi:hypothetical protein